MRFTSERFSGLGRAGRRGVGWAGMLALVVAFAALPEPVRAQAPTAPTGVSAIAGNNGVSLYWTAENPIGAVITYNIYVGLSAGGEGSTPAVTGVKTASFEHYGATNGTTYYYEVTAANAFGESPHSAEVSAAPAIEAPAPPAGIKVTPGSSQIALTWSASSTAASYKVYRAAASGGPYTAVGSPTSTSYTDTGVTNGTSYWYQLTSVSSYGESVPCPSLNVVANPPPNPPAGLAGTASGGVTLTWNASTGASSYFIYRSTGGQTFNALGSSSTTTYVDGTVTPSTTYWYYVTAVGSSGSESGVSNEINVTADVNPLQGDCGSAPPPDYQYVSVTPEKLSAVTGAWMSGISLSPSIQVQWTQGSGGGCHVYYLWTRTGGGTDANGTTSSTTLNDGFAFAAGTTYTYTITEESGGISWTTSYINGNLWYIGVQYTPSDPVSISVTPQIVPVSDNAAVDARYDMRYGNPTFLDFNFASSSLGSYRGGLYVGNSTDPSRMGRSFLRFTPGAAGSGVWAGSVSSYLTGAYSSLGNVSVGLQGVTDNGWTPNTLKWSNAPPVTPAAAQNTSLVTYDTNNPFGYWVHWPLDGVLWNQLTAGAPLVAALAVTTETTDAQDSINDWMYFAKKEYSLAPGPLLVYATGAPPGAIYLTISPNSITGGSGATGTAYMNGQAGAGGFNVNLQSDNLAASVPSSVTIPQGSSSVDFPITTTTVTQNTTVHITATATAPPVQATLTVTP